MVYWVFEIEINSAIDIFNIENCIVYSNGRWEDVNCGATLWSAPTMTEPLTYYVEIVLPDDKTIAGKQLITINNQKSQFISNTWVIIQPEEVWIYQKFLSH